MNIFAIIGIDNEEAISQFIKDNFPNNFKSLNTGEWFIATNKTTNEIATFFLENQNKEDAEFGLYIFLPVSNWNGWHDKEIWEWLSLKSKEIVVASNEE